MSTSVILSNTRKDNRPAFVCLCSCGSTYTVRRSDHERGKVSSCGCKLRKHGLRDHELYGVWRQMMARCYNEGHIQFAGYGGRGISVCERWHNLSDFITDITSLLGDRPKDHQLDRIDNDGNYCPENCRWATRKQNTRNTRRTRLVTVNGITKCASAWAEEYGLHIQTLLWRLRNNVPEDKLLLPPAKKA